MNVDLTDEERAALLRELDTLIDGIRDDPLDGANVVFSHALLLATPHTDNALHIPSLPTSGHRCNHWLMIPRSGHEP